MYFLFYNLKPKYSQIRLTGSQGGDILVPHFPTVPINRIIFKMRFVKVQVILKNQKLYLEKIHT